MSKRQVDGYSMVKCNPNIPKYIYQYELLPTAVGSVNQQLVYMASHRVSPGGQFMKPENLHCTTHITTGPDRVYEKVLKLEKVNVKEIYWSGPKCAAAVEFFETPPPDGGHAP